MEINNKKDFTSSIILTSVWALLAVFFYIAGPLFIGAVFTCSALISGYYTLAYYLKSRKEICSTEECATESTDEALVSVDIDQ